MHHAAVSLVDRRKSSESLTHWLTMMEAIARPVQRRVVGEGHGDDAVTPQPVTVVLLDAVAQVVKRELEDA